MSTPTGSPADEVRAYYGCAEVEKRGLRAMPAYDELGRPTGRVAIDPDEVRGGGLADLARTRTATQAA